MLEDRLLLWKFKRGSSEALERIYDKYETYLITVATALLNNTHAAEDVLHDFFVSFVQSAEKVKLNGNLKSYLAVCVANLARNKIKRRQIEPGSLDDGDSIVSTESEPDLLAMQKEDVAKLNEAMAQLAYEQREVIVLHLQGNMKFTQIAKLRSTSVNTIRSRYRYGLDKLRSLLNSEVII
ncbi:MAG: sigma-70 family RNA polymerase sigma factor [Sedimentisphaerales bacterium]|nr:sigma-70 family RNA polymerase sigma factor [Sedimentisphaerales bacterium]